MTHNKTIISITKPDEHLFVTLTHIEEQSTHNRKVKISVMEKVIFSWKHRTIKKHSKTLKCFIYLFFVVEREMTMKV